MSNFTLGATLHGEINACISKPEVHCVTKVLMTVLVCGSVIYWKCLCKDLTSQWALSYHSFWQNNYPLSKDLAYPQGGFDLRTKVHITCLEVNQILPNIVDPTIFMASKVLYCKLGGLTIHHPLVMFVRYDQRISPEAALNKSICPLPEIVIAFQYSVHV